MFRGVSCLPVFLEVPRIASLQGPLFKRKTTMKVVYCVMLRRYSASFLKTRSTTARGRENRILLPISSSTMHIPCPLNTNKSTFQSTPSCESAQQLFVSCTTFLPAKITHGTYSDVNISIREPHSCPIFVHSKTNVSKKVEGSFNRYKSLAR